MKEKHYKMEDGELVETCQVSAHVSAPTKGEALKRLARLGAELTEHYPPLKFRNGAYQTAFPVLLDDGKIIWNVVGGVVGERGACFTSADSFDRITDDGGSFAYYASEDYQNCRTA